MLIMKNTNHLQYDMNIELLWNDYPFNFKNQSYANA